MNTHFQRAIGLALAAGALLLAGATVADAQQRTLHAIHSSSAYPMAFKQGDGPSQGFLLDVCGAIAADNGWAIDYQAMPFADMTPAIATGKADLICSTFSYTAERATQMAFTPSLLDFGEGMIVPKSDTTAYKTWAEVKDVPVGSLKGSTILAGLQKSGASNVHIYDTSDAVAAAVVAGEIKAGFSAQPVWAYMLQHGYPELRLVESYQPSVIGPVNIAVRKDDAELLAAVNASLAKLGGDGSLRKFRAAWGF
jgi:polar amino acid transport system substrate-binding protein